MQDDDDYVDAQSDFLTSDEESAVPNSGGSHSFSEAKLAGESSLNWDDEGPGFDDSAGGLEHDDARWADED